MRDEIGVIREDHHCTSVSVFGTDIDRLRATGEVAAGHGLSVRIQAPDGVTENGPLRDGRRGL